jgi:predicted nucleic acid-binding protein
LSATIAAPKLRSATHSFLSSNFRVSSFPASGDGARLYVDLNLPLADAYHAVLMTHLNTTDIVSFDHHFDRIPGIVRREP